MPFTSGGQQKGGGAAPPLPVYTHNTLEVPASSSLYTTHTYPNNKGVFKARITSKEQLTEGVSNRWTVGLWMYLEREYHCGQLRRLEVRRQEEGVGVRRPPLG